MSLAVKNLSDDDRKIVEIFTKQVYQLFGTRIRSVILFGSRARGDASPDSDMDIAVILDQDDPESRNAVRELAADIGLDHDLFISTRIWGQQHWNFIQTIQTSLYRNIQKDGVELLPVAI